MVSIIVPVYNIEKYISDCINSLINQTYKNIEIILVNDGSSDHSLKICNEFANSDSRISIVDKQNGGLSSARNAGIDVASGDYIMFIDGDDYIADNTIEHLVDLINEYNCDMVQYHYIETTDEYQNQIASQASEKTLITDTRQKFENLYKIGGPAASACTKLYKSYLFDNLRFKEGIHNEDEQLITFMLQKAVSVLYTDFKPYYYVTRQGSIINSTFSRKKLDILDILEERKEQLNKLNLKEFINIENNRIFISLINFWCEARMSNSIESRLIIANKLKIFLKNEKISLCGKFNLIYQLCKFNFNFIYLYYAYKKITNQL